MRPISASKSAALLLIGLLWGGTSWAGVVTESFSFDNNQMPTGWNIVFHPGTTGHNIQIVNNRLEMGQVDTYAGIYRPFNFTGVTQVKIEYDANIANVFWGQGSAASLMNDIAIWDSNLAAVSAAKHGYGVNQTRFNTGYYLPNQGYTDLETEFLGPAYGDYHISAVFENDKISMTATPFGDTVPFFSSTNHDAPGFLLSNMNNIVLWGVTTTGTSAYIENVKITTTFSEIREPTTLHLILMGAMTLLLARRGVRVKTLPH